MLNHLIGNLLDVQTVVLNVTAKRKTLTEVTYVKDVIQRIRAQMIMKLLKMWSTINHDNLEETRRTESLTEYMDGLNVHDVNMSGRVPTRGLGVVFEATKL